MKTLVAILLTINFVSTASYPATDSLLVHDGYCSSCERDSRGKIKRSPKMIRLFKRAHPCPSTGKPCCRCPGYVIDHIKPLYRGGTDDTSNMQWQTVKEAKEKDKWE